MKQVKIQKHFKRRETKYILDKDILDGFLQDLQQYMVADDYATSTITNIYFDTPRFEMIQDSLAKKHGREKVRMRLYDAEPTGTSQAFLEIKKKIEGLGYKFRLNSQAQTIIDFVKTGESAGLAGAGQVLAELDQLKNRYDSIGPMMYIYYDRQSFRGIADDKVRVTLDQNLVYRNHTINLDAGQLGKDLLDKDKAIMEIKVDGPCPDWLAQLLADYQLEQQSFSKYGRAYQLSQEWMGG